MPAALLSHEALEINLQRASSSQEEFIAWFDAHPIKSRIKKSCMHQQKLRCCYCHGFTNSTNNNEWDLEHILCEKDYPQLFSEPLNLAVACKRCNGNKKHKNVLIETFIGDLDVVPASADDYIIPHPHLTIWNEHMSHTAYLIYEGKTEKGRTLIDVCELRARVEKASGAPIGGIKAALATTFFKLVGPAIPAVGDEQAIRLASDASQAVEDVRFLLLEEKLIKDLATAERQAMKREKQHFSNNPSSVVTL